MTFAQFVVFAAIISVYTTVFCVIVLHLFMSPAKKSQGLANVNRVVPNRQHFGLEPRARVAGHVTREKSAR